MRTQRTKIGIQSGKQFLQHSLKGRFLLLCKQPSFVRPTQEMPHLVERTTGDANEPLMISRRRATIALRDIGANTVRRANQLMPHRVLGELLPSYYRIPNKIGQFLGHRIDPQIIQREFCHGDSATIFAHAWRPIANS
jgi:hypothetical protein